MPKAFMRTFLMLFCTFLGCFFSIRGVSDGSAFLLDDEIVARVRGQFGQDAARRLTRWQALINNSTKDSDWQKLHKVNQFVNSVVQYKSDWEHWGAEDYWATPLETLQTGAGDCEDYVILKYFTLRAMGVAEDKMRLMYVRALELNEPHMVLIYIDKPGDYPLVLDNINTTILPANRRTDLRPVYSFNTEGLWMARAQGIGNKVENSAGVSQWRQLLTRIETDNTATR